MPQPRFDVRWMLLVVAIITIGFGLLAASVRPFKQPRTATEALSYVTGKLSANGMRLKDYDAEVRREWPDSLNHSLFMVFLIKRDKQGKEVDWKGFSILDGGYLMGIARSHAPEAGPGQ